MPRVKRGVTAHRRHKKILKLTKGYRHGRKNIFRLAKQAVLKAGVYAYRDRRAKKREFRKLWIIKLNAAARERGLTYGQLIHGLKKAKIELDRKMLAKLAMEHPMEFSKIVKRASPTSPITNKPNSE